MTDKDRSRKSVSGAEDATNGPKAAEGAKPRARPRKRDVDLSVITSTIKHALETDEKLTPERLAGIASGVKAATVITDSQVSDHPVIFANPAFTALTGYAEQEILGRNCRILQGPDTDRDSVARIHEAIAQGRALTTDILNYRKNGTSFWNELSISPIHDIQGHLRFFAGLQNDVTTRRKMRAELMRSKEQFHAFFDRANLGIALTSSDGRYLEVNPAYASMLGYSQQDLQGRHFTFVTHPDDVPAGLDMMAKLVEETKDVLQIDKRYLHKDGRTMAGRTTLSRVRSTPDSPEEILVMVEDVTGRKQREEELSFQGRLLGAVGEAVIATEPTGTIVYWNSAAERLYGWTSAEAIGQNVTAITPATEARPLAESAMERLRAGEEWSGEFLVRRKDGTSFPALVTTTPVLDEHREVVGMIGVSSDLTEMKSMEDDVRASEQRFHVIFDHVAVGIVLVDPRGPIHAANPTFQRMFGYTALELSGLQFTQLSHPEDAELHRKPMQELLNGTREFFELERRYVRKSGEVFWARVRVSRPQDEVSDSFIIGMLEDISEQRHEAERRAGLVERERKVATRLRDLDEWRTAFLRIMAHEVRTPLGQIIGFADLLESESDRLSGRGQRHLAHIRAAGKNLESVVQRSFDLIALFTDRLDLDRAPVQIDPLVGTTLTALETRAEALGISTRFAPSDASLVVDGDSQWLTRALSALIDNGIKFSPRGGSVEVAVQTDGESIEIRILDTGPGIEAEIAEAIFSGQPGDALARQHGGMGMGLVLARRVAELHHGNLKLVPSERGACFVLSLPLHGQAR
jgi:PAS domain S-box-containing protein